jgi:hypothetical protein
VLRQYVFERLNTGGQPLNPQEVRNCIYSGNFNNMLAELARSGIFTRIWGIPPREPDEPHHTSHKLMKNGLYSSMADCQIVLRFFTLSDLSHFKGGMKKTLDLYMNLMKKKTKKYCSKLAAEYLELLSIAEKIYGKYLFRLPKKHGELLGRRSTPLQDAVLLGLNKNRRHPKKLIASADRIIKKTEQLLTERETYDAMVGRGNTKTAIEDRINIVDKMFKAIIKGY